MKVVINKCFGGFGISDQAFELLLSKKGIEYERVQGAPVLGYDTWNYYDKGFAGDPNHQIYDFQFEDKRDDPELIAVIEELGEKAYGWAADLKIVEIPDDVEWYVEEYDGREWIAEKHRTWE